MHQMTSNGELILENSKILLTGSPGSLRPGVVAYRPAPSGLRAIRAAAVACAARGVSATLPRAVLVRPAVRAAVRNFRLHPARPQPLAEPLKTRRPPPRDFRGARQLSLHPR